MNLVTLAVEACLVAVLVGVIALRQNQGQYTDIGSATGAARIVLPRIERVAHSIESGTAGAMRS